MQSRSLAVSENAEACYMRLQTKEPTNCAVFEFRKWICKEQSLSEPCLPLRNQCAAAPSPRKPNQPHPKTNKLLLAKTSIPELEMAPPVGLLKIPAERSQSVTSKVSLSYGKVGGLHVRKKKYWKGIGWKRGLRAENTNHPCTVGFPNSYWSGAWST